MSKQMIPIMTPSQRVEMFRRMYDSASALSTPGLPEFIESKGAIKSWIDNLVTEMDEKGAEATRGEIEAMVASYLKAIRRAAERHAEVLFAAHQTDGKPIEDLDLRIAQHVDMKLELSDVDGQPYVLYGRLPTPPPEPGYWGLASDWLNALAGSSIISAIILFRRLPIHEKAIAPLAGGDNKLIVDVRGESMSLSSERATQTSLALPPR